MLAVLDFLFFNAIRAAFLTLFLATGLLTSLTYGVVFGPLALFPMVPVGFGMGWKLADSLCRGLSGKSLLTFLTTDPLNLPEYPRAPVQRNADQ